MRVLTEVERRMVVDSGFFDPAWYSEMYPDVALTRFDPLEHFLCIGGFFLRNPGPLFDSAYYASQLTGRESAMEFPLLHYIGGGRCRGLKPHPEFFADCNPPTAQPIPENDNLPWSLLAQLPTDARILLLEDCGSEEWATLSGRHFSASGREFWKHLAGIGLKDGEHAVHEIRRMADPSWEYLVVGAETYRRIQHYKPFCARFEMNFPAVFADDGVGMVFDLRLADHLPELRDFLLEFKNRERRYPSVLNWQAFQSLGCFFPNSVVFSPHNPDAETLPYIDSSIDIVLIPPKDFHKKMEAKRVAKSAVMEIDIMPEKKPWLAITIERLGQENGGISLSGRGKKAWLAQITPAGKCPS